ncbi:MAG: type IX secretion system membrane protein PorP/SprF [Cyclobacteriaceae bacterium]|nr:type IX secretion system membrane protein PorP/SprF [Cyclobacteriaceae bacterium]
MKRSILTLIGLLLLTLAFAQDPEFSQYYAAPLYLNPAFTGTTTDHRFIANYRNQWPNIARGYVTTALSYDYNLHDYHSGVGFLVTMDKAGTAGMKSSQFNFLYSYRVNVANKWVISTGLSFGYAFRTIDLNKLIFADQLQFDSKGQVPSDDPALFNLGMSHYFDFNAGLLAYNKSFWFGFATSHLNQPNRTLLNQEATLPIKTTVHGGVRIPLNRGPFKKAHEAVLSPSFVYKRQGNFDQLDVGAYFLYDPIVMGVWYRGIPIEQNVKDNISQDAAVVILGFQLTKVEVMYSYDFTVSELGPVSGGTHEIALKYKLAIQMNSHAKKREKFIPCPTFNH